MKKIRSESTSSVALVRNTPGDGKRLPLRRCRGRHCSAPLADCVPALQGFREKRTLSVVDRGRTHISGFAIDALERPSRLDSPKHLLSSTRGSHASSRVRGTVGNGPSGILLRTCTLVAGSRGGLEILLCFTDGLGSDQRACRLPLAVNRAVEVPVQTVSQNTRRVTINKPGQIGCTDQSFTCVVPSLEHVRLSRSQ